MYSVSRSLSKTDRPGDQVHSGTVIQDGVKHAKIGPTGKPDTIQILLRSFVDRHKVFNGQVSKTRRRATEKAVHDLRVSTRRLMAVIDVVRTMTPGIELSKPRKHLKRLLGALSELRDVQVQIAKVRDLVGEYSELNLFLALLMVREKQCLRRAREELLTVRLQQIEDTITDAEQRLQTILADTLLREAARSIVLGRLAASFSKTVQLKSAALSGKGSRIHRLRIAFKRFRYTVEALEAILPSVTSRTLKAMNAYQVRMGDIQDIDVLIANIRRHARSHPRASQIQFRTLVERLSEKRRELVLEFVTSVDELGLFWKKLGKIQ